MVQTLKKTKPGRVSKIVGNYRCDSPKANFKTVEVRKAQDRSNVLLDVEFAINGSDKFNRSNVEFTQKFLNSFECKKIG